MRSFISAATDGTAGTSGGALTTPSGRPGATLGACSSRKQCVSFHEKEVILCLCREEASWQKTQGSKRKITFAPRFGFNSLIAVRFG